MFEKSSPSKMADWIPFVSQAKSLFQWVFGDSQGARETQIRFSKQCPVIAPVRALIELVFVSKEAAGRTAVECLKTLGGVADSIPIVGHLKGGVHLLFGDKEGSYKAVKAATRTTFSLVGGASGFLIGGPPGAVTGSLVGAFMMDGCFTAIDSAKDGKFTPNGIVTELSDVTKNPTDAGIWFDLAFTLVADGATGYFATKAYKNATVATVLRSYECKTNALIKKVGKQNTAYFKDAAARLKEKLKSHVIPKRITVVFTVVRNRFFKNDKGFEGLNKRAKDHCIKKENAGEIEIKKENAGEIEMMNLEKTYDYSVDANAPTYFEKKFPNVEPAIENRSPRTCAEPNALDQFFKKNPKAKPDSTLVISVKKNAKSEVICAVKRCNNCLAYSHGMGHVPGDLVDGFEIPKEHGYRNKTVRSQVGKGVAHVICDSVTHSKVSDKKPKGSRIWQHHKTNTLKQRKKVVFKPGKPTSTRVLGPLGRTSTRVQF